MNKSKTIVVLLVLVMIFVSGCNKEADTASYNLSVQADQFKILRRIVFYNGITDGYILEITGLCSIGNYDADGEVSITCKTGEDQYVKHYLGLSDNVTYFAEQLEAHSVDSYKYEVIFRPESILPHISVDIKE